MHNNLNKFILLMWKNWTLAKRKPVSTVFEILLPGLICLLLVAVRSIISIKEMPVKTFEPFFTNSANSLCSNTTVAITPRSTTADLVVKQIAKNCPKVKFERYNNTQELNKAIATKKFYAAIQFDDSLRRVGKNTNLPPHLKVTIRVTSEKGDGEKHDWLTNSLYDSSFVSPGPRGVDEDEGLTGDSGGTPDYQQRGFLFLQQLITMALINDKKTEETYIVMERYPHPSYLADSFYVVANAIFISFLVILSFMLSYVNIIRGITTEKEEQLKESMKVMGLPGWLHWLTWFVKSFTLIFIANILIVIFLKVKIAKLPVFVHTDSVVLLIFLSLFAASTITFAFLISVLFSKANIAVIIGIVLFVFAYSPFIYVLMSYNRMNLAIKLSSCLLANSAVSFGFYLIIRFEVVGEGVLWSNLWTPVSPDDSLTFGAIMLMLLLDVFLYLILALYIEAIFPGEFGVPKPWYFPLSRAYWSNKIGNTDNAEGVSNKGEFFEEFTEKLPKGIELRNLSKRFGTNTAVKNLTLDVYEGHVTVLLGHNGAGKSTTMSMITGMFPPTSGTAIVNGYDVRTSIGKVRDSMGLCLQHNVLFNTLTVREHLYFFGKLKGLRGNEVDSEINNYLKLLQLEHKKNDLAKTLSGGMKRKLSVAIALCGKSKVVMLDEPTSGMDPSARRTVWNLLQQQKKGRTLLLTTHFMDEADLLGDRIAIMMGGNLKCCGSSFFLKKKYGAGYYLIMEVSPKCIPQSVTNLLRTYIPQIRISSHAGTELIYQLSENDAPKFERMLQDLEANSSALGVQSYGISVNNLQEVFMKAGTDKDNTISNTAEQNKKIAVESEGYKPRSSYLTGCYLIYNQFYAMLLKKIMSTLRNWPLIVLQLVIPIFMIVTNIETNTDADDKRNYPALKITLDSYQNPVTLISGDKKDPLYAHYKNTLTGHGKVLEVTNITDTILTRTTDTPFMVKNSYIVGVSFKRNATVAWFNGEPYHSTPLSLALVLNALYKHHLGKEKSISFINHPLPFSLKTQFRDILTSSDGHVFMFGISMTFVASCYILFYVKERINQCKHLQYVSGLNVFVFWLAAFLSDLITYAITIIVIIITIAAIQFRGYKTPEEIGRLALILIYFGFFFLPFVYLASYCFAVPSSGLSKILVLGIFVGMFGAMLVQVVSFIPIIANPLNWILMFNPFYILCKSIVDIKALYSAIEMCSEHMTPEEYCDLGLKMCCKIPGFFSMAKRANGMKMLISFLMCVLIFIVLIVNDFGFFKFLIRFCERKKRPLIFPDLDNDVEKENQKIKTTPEADLNKQYCLVLRDVTKYYKNKLLAVNGICLGVKPFECFGLLGVNGAGKTTTFKMMTGEESFSYGDAWLKGLNIKTQLKQVHKHVGYCPQFDAVLDHLTVRETLKIFALIRGIPNADCKEMGEALAREFDFEKYLGRKIKKLSGGNKRKVSAALALIGDPPVIFLDEPSTGMDPASKRHLWTTLTRLRDEGKCIILTSHSMEECEALCTRLAIMVNGRFQCLGSVQHLKNKFAQGFSLTVKLKKKGKGVLDDEIDALDNFVKRNFPGAELKERFQQLVTYQLTKSTMLWSQIFGILERNKKQLNIEDYSIGQSSLEQVFLSFTQYQR